ncbi:MAG: hypothetical protein IKK39_11080, partial [Thermoguttaceae bacterium]|nr:hypothetical protein [Thermoguttaceae bacterium]
MDVGHIVAAVFGAGLFFLGLPFIQTDVMGAAGAVDRNAVAQIDHLQTGGERQHIAELQPGGVADDLPVVEVGAVAGFILILDIALLRQTQIAMLR